MLREIAIILVSTVLITILILFLIAGSQQYTLPKISTINPVQGGAKLQCLKQPVDCSDDADCDTKCVTGGLKCFNTNAPSNSTITKTQGICAPSDSVNNCKNGILTWTAKNLPSRMEWDCICPYPTVAGATNCDLNPNVCGGISSNFKWDYSKGPPGDTNSASCTCPPGTVPILNSDNVPMCVKNDNKLWYTENA